jgi:DNA repair protein RadC
MSKIKDLYKNDRPREKLIKKGASALKKEELIAILLRAGTKGQNALQMAKSIVKNYDEKKLLNATYQELKNIYGVGPAKAVQILVAFEVGKRLYKEKEKSDVYINSPEDVVEEVKEIRESKKEHFVALYLNARKKLIHKEVISIGTLDASLVHPREVFEPAVRELASQVIIVHNHPSGDEKPSEEDIKITKRIKEAGSLLGIDLADHIIITKKDYFSFSDSREL